MNTASTLVGRDEPVERLQALVDQIRKRGAAVMLIGEAGIGKSSVLAATAAYAEEQGTLVLRATGVESEAGLPFAGLQQLLQPVMGAVNRLPPALGTALLSGFGLADGPAPESFLVAMAALNLLAEVAETTPLFIAVDDVHWLDDQTQEAITFIARRIDREPIVVVGVVRAGHGGPFAAAGFPDLVLPALGDGDARQLLTISAPDLSSYDCYQILAVAAGNPLALVELPRVFTVGSEVDHEQMVPLTSRLERTFASRYADLPGPTRDMVLCTAVNDGDELSEVLPAASIVAGRPVTLEDVDRAVDAALVQVVDGRVRFRHPLVRSGVLRRESPARHQAAHAALAQILTAEPYRRTWHRAHSIIGPDDEVADELEANYDIAIQRGSAAAAIWSLERSAQLSTDSAKSGRRLLLAAEHAFEIGRADMVDRLLAAASRRELGGLDLARVEWLREIFNDGVPGDAARVHQLCAVAQRSSAAGDDSLALNLLLGAALRCWWADTGPEARAAVAHTTESMPATRQDPRHVAALAVAEPVRMAGAVTRSLSAIAVETISDANALRLLGMAAHAIGDAVTSIDLLERAARKLREQARLGLLSHVLTMQILDRLEVGDWAQAAANAEEGRRLAHDTGQPIWDTGSMSLTAVILGLKGENDQAQDLAAKAEYEADGRRLNDLLACVQLARGLGWTAARNFEEAYRALAPMFDPRSPSFHLTERYHAIMFLAEAAAPAGRLDHARQVLAEMEQVAAVSPAANLHLHLLYARAVLADDDAEYLFQAASVADLTRWPWVKARIELAYGEWLRRRRRPAEARPLLRAANMTFELVGAPTWAEQARVELRATGERVASDGISPQDKLSPQELQIARLAAEGLSNREIGQRLYLSPRTVGSHLYRIFPKLGIASRGQLAALFLDGNSAVPRATQSGHSDDF